MYKNRKKAAAMGILLVVCLLLFGAGMTMLAQWQKQKSQEARPPEFTELYRNQGLEPEETVDPLPHIYAEGKVYFSDRVVDNMVISEKERSKHALSAERLLHAAGEMGVRGYALTVPGRLITEDSFSQDPGLLQRVEAANTYWRETEKIFADTIGRNGTFIPVLDTILTHRQEYVYYRTDPAWTARGAYYGAQEFLKAADLPTFPMDRFYETARSSTSGVYSALRDIPSDRQYVFLYENYNPMVEFVGKDRWEPMVSIDRGGTGCFLGYFNQVFRLDGLADNGRVVLILGRANAKIMVPWLTTSFSKIVCVDMNEFYDGNLDFWALLQENSVTDLLIVEDSESMQSVVQRKTLKETAALAPALAGGKD